MAKHWLQAVIEEVHREPPYNYSGRGMYGKSCLAVNVDIHAQAWELAFVIGQVALGIGEESCPSPKYDTMGYGLVLYWPGIPFTAGSDD